MSSFASAISTDITCGGPQVNPERIILIDINDHARYAPGVVDSYAILFLGKL
jgi:hypothetical protein